MYTAFLKVIINHIKYNLRSLVKEFFSFLRKKEKLHSHVPTYLTIPTFKQEEPVGIPDVS